MSALVAAGCGAKTGLNERGGVDNRPVRPTLPPVCGTLRVRAPVGATAPLEARVEARTVPDRGYRWTLVRKPLVSMATAPTTDERTANFVIDAVGDYEFRVEAPLAVGDAGMLSCSVFIEGLNVDPNCPSNALPEPAIVALSQSAMQIAIAPAFTTARSATVGDQSLHVAESVREDVAMAVLELPAPMGLDTLALSLEAQLTATVGAAPILVGQQGRTVDGALTRRSAFRATAANETFAWVARDRLLRDLTRVEPGASRGGTRLARSFVFELTTVASPTMGRAVALLTVANEPLVDDTREPAAIRAADVTQATGIASASRQVGLRCQALVATRNAQADFLWLVDTSGSMDDEQERLGRTAERFFREMNAAGIDFRVGVIQAGGVGPVNLDDPGFEWISGTAADGPERLAHTVTHQRFRDDVRDRSAPYPLVGQAEEPVAATVLVTEEMERRRMTDRDDRRRFRADTTRAALFVTDEEGGNDDRRFFAMNATRWGSTPERRIENVAAWFRDRNFLTFGLVDFFGDSRCPSQRNFGPCVIAANGGGLIPLSTAQDAEVSAGVSRIIDAIAAESSEFVLGGTPIASSLSVRVDATEVPRSRAEGFDFGAGRQSIVFRGGRYRPRMGQTVRVAYFFWR
ncbi:MAG: hypothetical protein JNK05_07535 [Myxococcales bacterium]|nr:hypothetical protein [Myxococcales bacterium]